MLGFPIHCSWGLRLLGFQLLGFYCKKVTFAMLAIKIPNLLGILPRGWIADPDWDRNIVDWHLGLQQT